MRFPSLQSLAGGAWQTFRRFPIAVLLALKATVLGIWWTHLSENYARRYIDVTMETRSWPLQWYWNAIVSCYLGMLLSVAMAKWAEKRQFNRRFMIGLQAGVLVLTALYYWSLPADYSPQMVIRTVVLALGLHWLIAVIGFGRGEVNGFWIFNKRLFLRMLTTYLYSIVLYIGVALALLAIDKLFNVDVRSEVYEECWWVLGGLFSVWFFLAGFPKTFENPGEISDYPRGLKIFTQYVLLSLVTVYLLILYAYMIKIILTRHWPVGWVAWMVMAFSVAGILSLLLIYPLRNLENNTWIRGYTRFFYQALLPLIILLFTAIYKRIDPYGITEQRYFLLALAWWLLFITVYFLVSRKKDIRLVPLSLCILSFLSCWGPWGAFAVSLNSQRHRLIKLLEKNGLMADGKVVTGKMEARKSVTSKVIAWMPEVHVPAKDRKAISSITDYIVEQHGYPALQPMFSVNIDSAIRRDSLTGRWQVNQQAQAIVHLMRVDYMNSWQTVEDSVMLNGVKVAAEAVEDFYIYAINEDEVITTDGAQYMMPFTISTNNPDGDSVIVGNEWVKICGDTAWDDLKIIWGPVADTAIVDLTSLAGWVQLRPNVNYGASQKEMTALFIGGPLRGKVVFKRMQGEKSEGRVRFKSLAGTLLISKK